MIFTEYITIGMDHPRLVLVASHQRREDLRGSNKPPDESDTTQDSQTDESNDDEKPTSQTSSTPTYKQGMTRQELKALDREIPWRKICEMPANYVDKFLEAIIKESDSWSTWQSVEPVPAKEAKQIMSDPVLRRRILKSRACYRDKSLGIGDIKAKCRIVALGHLDPDLAEISRNSATPGRIAEHIIYAMIVAGYNGELLTTKQKWSAWSGDAATAFLQGQQAERRLPLYLSPPRDGLISQTNTWQHSLYRIKGNIYGLANAPVTWNREVIKRLQSLSYQQHSFDKQFFYKVHNGQVVSAVLIYVDDFIGVHRADHQISELHNLFKWGSLNTFEVGKPMVFKGKELTLIKSAEDRFTMKITMSKFIQGLDQGNLRRGRLQEDPSLTEMEQKELRSVSGCLQ